MKMEIVDSGSILENGNGNSKMEMNPFQNGNEMDSAGREAKMEIAKWKWFHFAKWKWKCKMEVGSRNSHFHFENGIKMDPLPPPVNNSFRVSFRGTFLGSIPGSIKEPFGGVEIPSWTELIRIS